MISFISLAAAEGGLGEMAAKTAEKFGVQWWLFLSQIISFCLVAFLLQKFAYKPILTVLEERRRRIAQGLADAEKIKLELADAEKRSADIIATASAAGQKMIEEARVAAKTFQEKQSQQAIVEATQIIEKAREATTMERDKMMVELKREIARLVIDTTAKVAGKVLTTDDQRRLSEEASRQLAA